MNPAALRMLRVTLADVLGKPASEAFATWPALAEACVSAGDSTELRFDRPEGSLVIDVHRTPLRHSSGRTDGCLVMLRDVTARKQAEAECLTRRLFRAHCA